MSSRTCDAANLARQRPPRHTLTAKHVDGARRRLASGDGETNGTQGVTDPKPDIVLVHSSDLHVDDDPSEPSYGDDGTTGLRWVLHTAGAVDADIVLLVGDTFDNNRQSAGILQRARQMLADAGRPVVILPGNHDPLTPDSVYRRSGIAELPDVHVLGLTHDIAVAFPEHELEIWGHAHCHYDDMVPLRSPRPRAARWHIALAHGHYEPDGVVPLRPSWLISDAQITATEADYLALGHWNRAAQVGAGDVPAYYSGSPDLAGTVNVVRLSARDGVLVTREPVRR
jgi:DNA repair exonuclease SbcCD nuclease subunit